MEADETLKQQFKLLQDQQQLKLLRRKQMKEEKENSSNNSTKNKSFGIDDNLDLKIEKNIGSNYISEELVEHLNTQIRELRDENGRCYKLLSEREFEIKQLKKKKIEEKSALSGVEVTNETAATKIVELSKKVRELTSELESEKTKNKQIGKKCHDLQTQISAIPEEARNTFGSASTFRSIYSDNDREQAELDVKALQDKLKQTESKVAEFRNQSSQLKQDLKIAHKVLNQEVGENVNIQNLLSGNTNWRGRAQQILLLQKKVEELKQQVSPSKSRDEDDLENELMGRTSSTRRRNQDDKYREELRKYDKEKKEAQEKLVNEFKALENDHTALKSKMEAAKARNKVLATEMKSIKQQMATLLEKGKNDDELIQALMRQQSQLKEMLDSSNLHQKQNNLNQQDMLNELSIKSQQDHNIVEQLKTIVAEKEFKVHRLEEEINSLKLQHLQKIQDEGRSNISNTSRPFTSTNHDNLVLQSVTPPGTGSRRDERPPTVAGRVESARSLPSRSSVRPPSASHVSSNQETEVLQYQCQEYKILMQTADVEKEKLAELVKILQKRIEEAVLKHNESQTELINQRRNNALLEKQLAKYKVDQNKLAKGNTSARKKGLSSSGRIGGDPIYKSLDDETDVQTLEEIQTCLEIQKDENEALKSALHSTLQAKEEDLRIYSNTIDETKKVLLQALRQYKQNMIQHGTLS